MQETLKKIFDYLNEDAFVNEAAISRQAVMPVLGQLGWDMCNPAEVKPEYTTSKGKVDYALCLDGKARIFVEVKQAGTFHRGVEQLLNYAFQAGIEMAVLTDARRWSIYLPMESVPSQERRVELLDIADRSIAEAADVLRRYLERGAAQSGTNVKAAREDLRNTARQTKAAANIPDAWTSLLEEPDGLIAECLAERVEENTGVAPAEQDIRDYLSRVEVPRILQGRKSASTPAQDTTPPAVQTHPRSVALSASQAFEAAAQSDFHKVRRHSTTNIYRRRWLAFAKWCKSNEHDWLPAEPEHIAGWLEANWPRFAAQSLTHDLTAIKLVHKAHGHPDPVSRNSHPRKCWDRLKQKEAASGGSDQSPS